MSVGLLFVIKVNKFIITSLLAKNGYFHVGEKKAMIIE